MLDLARATAGDYCITCRYASKTTDGGTLLNLVLQWHPSLLRIW